MIDNGTREFLTFISRKWMYDVICQLQTGKKTFSELIEALDGVSNKMLSTRLSELQDNNFIQKVVYSLLPLNLKYELRSEGRELYHLYQKIAIFSKHIDLA